MSIGLSRHAGMLVVALAVLMTSVVVVLPGVAKAQGMEGASVVEAAQNSKQDAHYVSAPPPASEPATDLAVVVGAGDSLWSISQKRLGPEAAPAQIANEVERIFEVNRGRIGDDPNLIFAGQELLLPSVSEPITSVPAASEPATSVPAASEPVTTEAPSASEPVTTEALSVSEPVTSSVPAANEAATDVLAASEPAPNVQPADAGGMPSTTEPTFWQDERHLVGLGIIVLTFVLVGLMAWKLPLRRDTWEGAWEIPVGYSDYYYDIPPTFEDVTFASEHDFDREGITRVAEGRQKVTPRVRRPGPRRLPRKGWATGIHSPEVRRFLKRPPATTGRRASPLTKKSSGRGGPS